MGSELSVYIGPFVKCTNEQVDTNVKSKSCPNSQCKAYYAISAKSAQFCDCCGTKLEELESTIQASKVNLRIILGEIKERLFPIHDRLDNHYWRLNYWRSNIKAGKEHMVLIHDSVKPENRFQTFKIPDESKALEWFKKTFKKEIEVFIKAYGENCVEVCFGVMSDRN